MQKDRQEDDIQQKQDNKEESDNEEGASSGGVHKYFGKANKTPKLLTFKAKRNIKLKDSQNVSILGQINTNSLKDLEKAYQKIKLKCQYRWTSEMLNAKPKIKFTFNPFVTSKFFEEVLLNWKTSISQTEDQTFDFKFNQKKQINVKYKRTKFKFDKKHRHRLEFESTIEPYDLNFKNSISFESMVKSSLFQNFKYINSSETKLKIGIKDFNYQTKLCSYRFDLSEKLTFLIQKFKAKQETKANLSFGQKESVQVKGNFEITNDLNSWTVYAGGYGYKWGVGFDEFKFIYSIYENWKIGFMYGQKNTWQLMVQNPKIKNFLFSSLAFNLSNKNYSLVLKSKWNQKSIGKINFDFSVQNPLRNTNLSRMNFGFLINLNL